MFFKIVLAIKGSIKKCRPAKWSIKNLRGIKLTGLQKGGKGAKFTRAERLYGIMERMELLKYNKVCREQ